MRRFLSTFLTVAALVSPVSALAAPPSVTGLQASYANGQITVTWKPSEDLTVAYYRIYWSRQSILKNEGRWEDFEATQGKEPTYVLKDFPLTPSLWIGVMAVSTYGEESPFFTEEVKVDISEPASSVSSIGGSASFVAVPTGLDLVSVEALSATGVLIRFSAPVTVAPADATKAVAITDGSGNLLQLRRLTVQDATILVTTATQVRDIAYILSIGSGVKSGTMMVNPARSQARFIGHPGGLTAPAGGPQASIVQDVSNLSLNAKQELNGTYTVTATWIPRGGQDITGYQVRQTRDAGTTWSETQTIPASTTSVRVAGVPAGSFGFLVRVIGKNGLFSRGTFGTIDLPVFTPGQQPTNPPMVTPPTTPKPPKVPTTGSPEILVVLLAGLTGGFHATRKRLSRLTGDKIETMA